MVEINTEIKFILYRETVTWKLVNEEKICPAKGDERKAGGSGKTQNKDHKLV